MFVFFNYSCCELVKLSCPDFNYRYVHADVKINQICCVVSKSIMINSIHFGIRLSAGKSVPIAIVLQSEC